VRRKSEQHGAEREAGDLNGISGGDGSLCPECTASQRRALVRGALHEALLRMDSN
jgi:hypothetical protein